MTLSIPQNILHVDDDDTICSMTEIIFKRSNPNHQYKSCKSAKEFMDIITSFQPDLILLDYRMPEMTGLEILKKIKEEKGANICPSILLTGFEEEIPQRDYHNLRIIGTLKKPFRPKTLLPEIEKIWSQYIEKEKSS